MLRDLCWKRMAGKSEWLGLRKWMGMLLVVGRFRLPGRLRRECRGMSKEQRQASTVETDVSCSTQYTEQRYLLCGQSRVTQESCRWLS